MQFPPISIFGGCIVDWNNLASVEKMYSELRSCRVYDFDWMAQNDIPADCQSTSRRIDDANRGFPYWLRVDRDLWAWTTPIPQTHAVMHFRGGDVFGQSPPGNYVQPTCKHYLESFYHSKAACAALIIEDERNPCVDVVRRHLPCVEEFAPDKCNSLCAFTLLARARILIRPSVTTFSDMGYKAFRDAEKVCYVPYCASCPERTEWGTQICTDSDQNGLVPWGATQDQLNVLTTRDAKVKDCAP